MQMEEGFAKKTCPLMTRNASPLGLAVQPAVRTTSSERNAAMFAQIASMILRGIREFDEVARELEKDISGDGSSRRIQGNRRTRKRKDSAAWHSLDANQIAGGEGAELPSRRTSPIRTTEGNHGRPNLYASVESTYAAMEQMLQFSAVLDVVSRNADERTVTFSVPGINGLFTAKVAEGDAAGSSKVTVTAPIDGGDKAQESVAKFYKDLGDQLMVQGAVQSAPQQTPVFDAQNQPTQTFQAPVPAAAGNGGNPAQGTKNKFVAMLTDTNTGKTSVMAIAAAVVSAVFLIFGFVSLGMHLRRGGHYLRGGRRGAVCAGLYEDTTG